MARNDTGYIIVSMSPQNHVVNEEFRDFMHNYGGNQAYNSLYFKKKTSAMQVAAELAKKCPQHNVVVCPITDLFHCESSPAIHRKVTEKGEIIPGDVLDTGAEITNEMIEAIEVPNIRNWIAGPVDARRPNGGVDIEEAIRGMPQRPTR